MGTLQPPLFNRISKGGRYIIAVTANGALAIANPLVGIITAGVTPDISHAYLAVADHGANNIRTWINNGAGGLVDWNGDATFTVNVSGYVAPFTLVVAVRLPLTPNYETVGTGAIAP